MLPRLLAAPPTVRTAKTKQLGSSVFPPKVMKWVVVIDSLILEGLNFSRHQRKICSLKVCQQATLSCFRGKCRVWVALIRT